MEEEEESGTFCGDGGGALGRIMLAGCIILFRSTCASWVATLGLVPAAALLLTMARVGRVGADNGGGGRCLLSCQVMAGKAKGINGVAVLVGGVLVVAAHQGSNMMARGGGGDGRNCAAGLVQCCLLENRRVRLA